MDAPSDPTTNGDLTPELVDAPDAAIPSPDAASSNALELRHVRLLTAWISESSRQRLSDSYDYEMTDDVATASSADLVVVSTRAPRGHASATFRELQDTATCPIVVLTHAGGENLAVEFMRAGAAGVLAEGNEESLRAFLGAQPVDAPLIEAYEQRLGRVRVRESDGPVRDPVTGLATTAVFRHHLAELGQAGELPRVGFLRVVNFDDAARRLSVEAISVLRRRLAAQYRELCRMMGAELFGLATAEYAFVGPRMSPQTGQELGWGLVGITETFSPSGSNALALAVGHAGPEVASEVSTLRELAHRALLLAGSQRESTVVSADDLSRSLASSTELEAALKLVEAVERADPASAAHGARTASLAADIAQVMGFDGPERTQIRLAAHLHDIGLIRLPPEALGRAPEELDDVLAGDLRRHPERGADYLRVSAGREVAAAVRAHHEHWDGSGFPDGLAGEAIPVAGRIIAVACTLLRWGFERRDTDRGAIEGALAPVRDLAGSHFDPAVVGATEELLLQAADHAELTAATSASMS